MKSSRIKTIIITAGLGVIAAIGTAWLMLHSKPSLTAAPAKIIEFVASKPFQELPEDQKVAYAERFMEIYYKNPEELKKLSPRQLSNTRFAAEETLEDHKLKKYLTFTTKKERDQFLDKQIEEMQNRIKLEMERAAAAQNNPTPEINEPEAPAESSNPKTALEKIDAAKMGALIKYSQDLAARIEERGLLKQ